MPLRRHPLDQVLAAGDLPPDQEEGGGDAPLQQAVQQPFRGLPAGPVVKRNGNQVFRRDLCRAVCFLDDRAAGRTACQQRQSQA